MTGIKKFGLSKQKRVALFKEAMTYPYDCSFVIEKGSKQDRYTAREEISTACDKFGRWVGSGCYLGNGGACDTQIKFKTLTDVTKALRIAKQIAKKYNLNLNFDKTKYTKDDNLEVYKLTESDVN